MSHLESHSLPLAACIARVLLVTFLAYPSFDCAPGSALTFFLTSEVYNVALSHSTADLNVSPPSRRTDTNTRQLADSSRNKTMTALQTCVLGHWTHSYEEDEHGLTVYRPADYDFPPARGRKGLEFREGGRLVYYGIGRADGSEEFSGSWKIEEPNRIKVEIDNERIAPFVLEIVHCDHAMLKVRQ